MKDDSGQTAVARFEPPTDPQLREARKFVGKYAEGWNGSPVSVEDLRDQMHSDTRMLIPPMTEPAGRDAVVSHFAGVLQRIPDLKLEVIRWAPTGDVVFVEWKARATVGGQLVSWTGVDRFRLSGDLQIEGQAYWDTLGLEAKVAAAFEAANLLAAAQKR